MPGRGTNWTIGSPGTSCPSLDFVDVLVPLHAGADNRTETPAPTLGRRFYTLQQVRASTPNQVCDLGRNALQAIATVVNTFFIGTVGAVALAVGLAFGLGGQNTAAQITQGWYLKGQEASQKVARYAETKQAEASAIGAQSNYANPTAPSAATD